MMNGRGKSDSLIVPGKPPNKALGRAAEAVEGRRLAKGNLPERNMLRTQGREGVSNALEGGYVRQLDAIRGCGLRRSCTTFTPSSGCGRPILP